MKQTNTISKEKTEKNANEVIGSLAEMKEPVVQEIEEVKASGGKRKFLLGTLLGTFVGASAALVLAPKAGKDLQGDIKNQAKNLKEKNPKESVQKAKEQIKEKSNELMDKAKQAKKEDKDETRDIGTTYADGKEAMDVEETVQNTVEKEKLSEDDMTPTAQAFKEALNQK